MFSEKKKVYIGLFAYTIFGEKETYSKENCERGRERKAEEEKGGGRQRWRENKREEIA